MKQTRLILSLLLTTLLMLLCACGSDGPEGPAGVDGDPGEPGPDYTEPVPEDQVFGIAIFNGSEDAHNGNVAVLLTADETATEDGNTLIARKLDRPPVLDGRDDGDALWGGAASPFGIDRTPLKDNLIRDGLMRAGYDGKYLYLQFQWTEVEGDGFTVGEDREYLTWERTLDTNDSPVWVQNEVYEDKLSIMWLESGEYYDYINWETDGCKLACHAERQEGMYAVSDTTDFDTWVWGAATTDYLGFAQDAMIGYVAENDPVEAAYQEDQGAELFFDNFESGVNAPLYQHKEDPNTNPPYPLMYYDIMGYSSGGWDLGSTIPGIIGGYPTHSAADIEAKGRFNNGTWTVELRRLMDTKNYDDVEF